MTAPHSPTPDKQRQALVFALRDAADACEVTAFLVEARGCSVARLESAATRFVGLGAQIRAFSRVLAVIDSSPTVWPPEEQQ